MTSTLIVGLCMLVLAPVLLIIAYKALDTQAGSDTAKQGDAGCILVLVFAVVVIFLVGLLMTLNNLPSLELSNVD